MTCSATREWILEVDPDELERSASPDASPGALPNPSAEHADHLAECPECRALADEILGAESALRDGLDSVEPDVDVVAALDRARKTHQAAAHQTARRRRRWQVAVPLAAAALGGTILMGRPSSVPGPGFNPATVPAFDPATVRAARALGLVGPRPVVKVEGDQRVAVLPTRNPNITVIWFME